MKVERIDRSTRTHAAALPERTARALRFLLAGVALLVAACSSLKLGYDNADTLLLYSLDSYFDLDDRQRELARERVNGLLAWHRSTQLDGYAQWLAEAQRKVDGRVGPADIADLQRQMNDRLAAIGEQAAPDLAALALTLTPEQIDHFAAKLATDTSKARRELLRFAGERESLDERLKRYVERAESWFGSVNNEQIEIARAALAARSSDETWWMDEREQRQREAVQLLKRIIEDKPPAAETTRRVREYFAQLAEPRDEQRRAALAAYRQSNAELIARLINAAKPEQRAVLARKLRDYAEDFVALAAAAGNGKS